MLLTNLEFFTIFLTSFTLTSLLTPLMRFVALRTGVTDKPNQGHKTHKSPVPYLGGVAIVIGVTFVTLGAVIISQLTSKTLDLAVTILVPAVLMAIVGLVDDIKQLSPWPRFITQNILAIIATSILIQTNTLGTPVGVLAVDFLITMVWIVGITNSINFFDNIDGGASGAVAISALAIFAIAFSDGQFLIASMSLVLVGATLGFLIWNRPPARIYMGDAGALFLGILIASLTVRLDMDPEIGSSAFFVPIFILAIPIMDTSVAVIKRLWRGLSPFEGGRDHLSHRLMRFGLSKRRSVFILWFGSGIFSLLAFLVATSKFQNIDFLVTLGVVIWIVFFVIFLLTSDKD